MSIREGMTVRRTNRQALFFLGNLKVIERYKDTAQVENADYERTWIAVSELEQVADAPVLYTFPDGTPAVLGDVR